MSTAQANKKNGVQQDSNIINQVLFRYLPYWPLFIIMLLVGILGAYLYIRYKVPVYEATATILVKDEKKGIDDSQIMESLNLFGGKKIVENEIEIIRSRTLLKEVVKNLHLYSPVYEEGKVNTVPAFAKSPIEIELREPDSLMAVGKIYFTVDNNIKLVTIEGKEYPVNQWVNSPWGVIRFTPNPYHTPSNDNKPLYFSLENMKDVVGYLNKQLTVSPASKQSTIINLKVKDPVATRGELILNELIKVYNGAAINDKNLLAGKTLRFVEDRLHLVVSELDSVETVIQRYKTKNNIVDISSQGQMFLENAGASDNKLSEISVQLSVLKEVEDYVKSKKENSGIVPSTLGLNDPVLGDLLTKLYDAESQYDRLKKTTGENSPILVSLQDQINRIKPGLLENISSQRRNLEASKNNLSSTSGYYNSMLRTIPQKERELIEISRQQSIKNSIYTFLLQKREETALSYNSTVSDSRIVDNGESASEPVSPNKLFVYLIAVFGSLALAIIIIAIREGLNKNILFRSEIESFTTVPVIGEVVADTSGSSIVISQEKRNFIAEQFRQLRTSLSYLGINSRKKKILITSSIPGEGKSFVAANLAISLALTDKKVVLIELDLRKPKLSEIFGMKSTSAGITNYFIGDKEADEIIKRTEVNPNLFLISAGPIPPNPSELILNGKVQELLAYLENAFDYIVIDTAPVSPVTDAYLLSQFCDATLYVVRHGYTPRMYIQLMDENNKVRGLKNLAIIFNGVKARGLGKGGYGYGYGYGYGVGYDENENEGDKKKKSLFSKITK